MLEVAQVAFGVLEVGDGAAAGGQGPGEDVDHLLVEAFALGRFQGFGPAEGVEAGLEQGFVNVDVAQPGQEALVQEERFQPAPAAGQAVGEFLFGNGQGRRGPGRTRGRSRSVHPG